ncbi:hypothetical protein TRIUR3_20790 [Triticum urartu]|uniref:Pentatricopeptide repeat-containing protein n=1 Tax=Triticum urartu TaxID=4572 RepID=M8AJ48_TRIUA|nr:hypothetical protein TRIUR3_20790 [Triticum urartu]
MSLLEARLSSVAKNCTRRQLNQIHGLLLTSSLHRLPGLPALLVRRAADVGDMAHADLLFSSFLRSGAPPDAALYNAMIRGRSYHGPHERALELFDEMPRRGLVADGFTYPYVLDACARLRARRRGEGVHGRVLKEGLDHVPAVGSSLLAFYVSVGGGSLGDARRLFDGLRVRSVGLSNHMIAEHAKAGDVGSAREVFDAMPDRDVVSWNTMLAVHVRSGDIAAAKELFAEMPERDVVSWTTMLRALSVAGDFAGMRSLFSRMPERNLVSWNCVLSSYTRHGRFSQALRLFPWMLLEGHTPNSFTVVSLLSACEHLRKLRMGRWVHANLVTPALQAHAAVGTALVEMYAMCGDVARALVVFFKMRGKDVFAWNVMIRGLAVHGRAGDALRLFDLMKRQGFRPDRFTFMGVLLACSHGGLVGEGRRAFDAMQRDHGVRPSPEHYGCLVDLLCRGGDVDGAVSVVRAMPCRPDRGVWRALLGGCGVRAGLGSAEDAATATGGWSVDGEPLFLALTSRVAMAVDGEQRATAVKNPTIAYRVASICDMIDEHDATKTPMSASRVAAMYSIERLEDL